MTKIKFTSGTIQKLNSEYYTLTLYNNKKVCYTATIGVDYANELIKNHNKIYKLI